MSEDEIIKYIKDEIEDDKDTMSWFDDKNNVVRKDFEKSINAHQGLLDLYQKEKERAERHKSLYLMEKDYQENKLDKYLTDKIYERKFELQQEYKDFEDDIRLKILEEIHKELLGENNGKQM